MPLNQCKACQLKFFIKRMRISFPFFSLCGHVVCEYCAVRRCPCHLLTEVNVVPALSVMEENIGQSARSAELFKDATQQVAKRLKEFEENAEAFEELHAEAKLTQQREEELQERERCPRWVSLLM